MKITCGYAVVTLTAAFKCNLVNVAFNVVETLLKGHFVAGLFLALAHFEAAAVLKLNGFLVSSKIAVAYVMWAT